MINVQQFVLSLSLAFGKDAVLEEHTDASLLGGVVLRIGDKVYDGSVQGKLQQMRQTVLSGVAAFDARQLRFAGFVLVDTNTFSIQNLT